MNAKNHKKCFLKKQNKNMLILGSEEDPTIDSTDFRVDERMTKWPLSTLVDFHS